MSHPLHSDDANMKFKFEQ